MQSIFALTFPFFALVLCGYLATRLRGLPLEAIAGLNGFVLHFALPCMLFRFGAATPIARLLDAGSFLTWLVCALLMVGLCLAATRRGATGWNDAAFGALVAAFPNSGFMGVPLLVALLGEPAAAPAIVALSVDMVITSSLCIALSRIGSGTGSGSGGSGGNSGSAAKNALKGMASNPLPWAIGLGCAVSAAGLALPGLLTRTVGMLADAASPLALFTLGAMLARPRLAATAARPQAAGRAEVGLIVGFKLLLHPVLMWLAARLLIATGVPLDAQAATALVLLAALPSASNVPMLAERFGADGSRIARVVLVTTALAFFSFSAAVAWMT
jgi:predicted permease